VSTGRTMSLEVCGQFCSIRESEKSFTEGRGCSIRLVTDQPISSVEAPLGCLLGLSVGWAIKKIMKLAFIGLGLLVLLIGLLEYQRWITINWSIVENQTSVLMTHAANKIATITQHMNHEIPIWICTRSSSWIL